MLWIHSSDRAQLGDQPTDEPQMAAADAAWPMLQNEFFLMRSFRRRWSLRFGVICFEASHHNSVGTFFEFFDSPLRIISDEKGALSNKDIRQKSGSTNSTPY